MSDIADQAEHQEELMRQLAQRFRHPKGPKPTGQCLNCQEDVPRDHRWCDAECRDIWAKREGK